MFAHHFELAHRCHAIESYDSRALGSSTWQWLANKQLNMALLSIYFIV